MARILRSKLPAGFFHITARSVKETMLFRDDRDRLMFALLLGWAIRRFGLRLHAYCLMGTHYHAIVEGPTERVSRAVQWFQSHHAREYNARHGRRGALFAERFASWVISTDEHLEAATAYVLANPVEAGLVSKPEDWPWSWATGTTTIRTDEAREGAAFGGSLSRPPAGSTRTRARHEKKMPGESERQTIRASFRPNRTLVRVHPRG